jgi:predicted type IV restriction endonuclease
MQSAMEKLNLPEISARIRAGESGRQEIFDEVRRKYVKLTPEEWVRQHFLLYMISQLGYPASLIVVEAALKYNNLLKRFDILAYRKDGTPCLVVECKAPSVEITQSVFDQVAMYNMTLQVDYLAVTNGLVHYTSKIDHVARTYSFLKEIPSFSLLNQ